MERRASTDHGKNPSIIPASVLGDEDNVTSDAEPASAHVVSVEGGGGRGGAQPQITATSVSEKAAQDLRYEGFLKLFEDSERDIEDDEKLRRVWYEVKRIKKAAARSAEHSRTLFTDHQNQYAEWAANDAHHRAALKAQGQDRQTILLLREQIKEAKVAIGNSAVNEEAVQERIRVVRHDVSQLENILRQGVGLSVSQERAVNELRAAHEMGTRELEQEIDQIAHMRGQLNDVVEKIRATDMEKRDIERNLYDLKESHVRKKAEIDAELRNKERLEYDMREIRATVNQKTSEVRLTQDHVNRANDDIGVLEAQIQSQRNLLERLLKDQENLHVVMMQLQADCDRQIGQTTQLYDENVKNASELQLREKELAKQKSEGRKINKVREGLNAKISLLEKQKLEAEEERKEVRNRIDSFTKNILDTRQAAEGEKKLVDDARRELEILKSGMRQTQNNAHRLVSARTVLTTARNNLEIEISRFKQESRQHAKELERLTAERDAYLREKTAIQSTMGALIDNIKTNEIEIFDLKKRTTHAYTKLKHQQNLYEAVQSDRNLHSKHLIQAQADIGEMKRKLKIMNFQINGSKEDIVAKDETLVRAMEENTRLTDDADVINDEVKNLRHQCELAQTYIRAQSTESMRLNQFVKEADAERVREENALKLLISERDNLSSQLMRQDKELERVYARIKSRASAIARAEKTYDERMAQMREARRMIFELRKQNHELRNDTSRMEMVKSVVCFYRKELLREKTREKALQEELKHAVNVHRWRRLDGSDPNAIDNIQLLQTLQRRLIQRTEELEQKERLLAGEERLYLELRAMSNKQVGPEALEQAREQKMVLKTKIRQYKHMGTELSMYRAQCKETRYSIQQVERSLLEARRRWFESKRGSFVAVLSPSQADAVRGPDGRPSRRVRIGAGKEKEFNEGQDSSTVDMPVPSMQIVV